MVYDCFTFFNELDLLEIRLNVLKDVVDKFVLVEAPITFTGKQKPLFYDENKARYAAFADRIIHVVVDDFSAACHAKSRREKAFSTENIQRNAIALGLKNALPEDTVIISDIDEIPDPNAVLRAAESFGVTRIGMRISNYYVNYRNYSTLQWTLGTQIMSYSVFSDATTYKGFRFNEFVIENVNAAPSASMARFLRPNRILKNAGWHFTYLGGVEAIRTKIRSISHTEYDTEELTSDEWIEARIAAGEDPFKRGDRFFVEPLDASYPEYLVRNAEKYSHLIRPCTMDAFRKTASARRVAAFRGAVRRFVIRLIPEALIPFAVRMRDRLHGIAR